MKRKKNTFWTDGRDRIPVNNSSCSLELLFETCLRGSTPIFLIFSCLTLVKNCQE